MSIVNLFIDNLPYSLLIFIVPVIIWWLFFKEKKTTIQNRVEVFHKGYTKGYYPAKIDKSIIKFKIGESEYQEPVLYFPRIERDKGGTTYRTYLYAEGLGTVDIPPLTSKDRKSIIETLKMSEILEEEDREKELTDDELIRYVNYYNFDIEQLTDKPANKDYVGSMNAFEHLVGALIKKIGLLDKLEYSNFAKFMLFMMGGVTGFFMAYSLALKGVI